MRRFIMDRLEKEIFDKLGGMDWEYFMTGFICRLKPEAWEKIKNMSLEEFDSFKKEIPESWYRIKRANPELKISLEKEKTEESFPRDIFLSSSNGQKENTLHIYPDFDFLYVTNVGQKYGEMASNIKNHVEQNSSKHFRVSNLFLTRIWTELVKLKEAEKKELINLYEYQKGVKKLLTDNLFSDSDD